MSCKRLIIIQPYCACSKGAETTLGPEVIVQPVAGTTVVPLIKTATNCVGDVLEGTYTGWTAHTSILAVVCSSTKQSSINWCCQSLTIVTKLIGNTKTIKIYIISCTKRWNYGLYVFQIGLLAKSGVGFLSEETFIAGSISGSWRQTKWAISALLSHWLHTTAGSQRVGKYSTIIFIIWAVEITWNTAAYLISSVLKLLSTGWSASSSSWWVTGHVYYVTQWIWTNIIIWKTVSSLGVPLATTSERFSCNRIWTVAVQYNICIFLIISSGAHTLTNSLVTFRTINLSLMELVSVCFFLIVAHGNFFKLVGVRYTCTEE